MKLNFKEIIEGWRNHLVPPKDLKEFITEVSEDRLSICAGCPFQSDNARVNGQNIFRMDLHCTKCGCPLAAKTKSLSSKCPLYPPKWDAVTTDAERYEIEQQINKDNELQTGDS